jgi:RNA recognition motif-containing protein
MKVCKLVMFIAISTLTQVKTEICEDVQDECAKFGKVVELKVPRPSGGSRQSVGVGKIYVKYDSEESATKALTALAGRKFADRTVVATYFPEVCIPRPCYFKSVNR